MKKHILTAVASLAVAAAMSVSAFAVESGSTNGLFEGTVGEDGKVVLSESVSVEGLPAGTEVEVDVEPAAEEDTTKVIAAVEKDTSYTKKVESVNTVIEITADNGETQPDGSVKVTVAYDGVSNAVLYVGETVEELELDVVGNVASFTTTHFSTFYMVTLEKTTDNGPTDGGDKDPDKNQPTGVVLAVVPAIAAAAAIVVSKKRK